MVYRKLHCSLSSLNVLLVSFSFLDTCVCLFFSENPIFLIYSSLLHILTFHLYLTNLYSWHLSLFTFEEGGRRSLLSCDLHCSGHFLVNAADKPVTHHLMRKQQTTPNWKLPLLSQILSLFIPFSPPGTSLSPMTYPFLSLGDLPPRAHSLWHPNTNTATLQLHPRSSGPPHI